MNNLIALAMLIVMHKGYGYYLINLAKRKLNHMHN